MRFRIHIIAVLAAVLGVLHHGRAGEDEIRRKQSELATLRQEIAALENRLQEQERKESATLDLLDTYDRKGMLLRKLISRLYIDAQSLSSSIEQNQYSANDLSAQVSHLRNHYASSITSAYKFGRTYDLELLLASKSLNQLLIRSEYLKRFSDQRKRDLENLTARQDDLEATKLTLQQQLVEQRDLIAEKAREETKLTAMTKKRKSVLAEIRRDKKTYQKGLKRKLDAVREIEQLIVRLIEEERLEKEREERLAREGKGLTPPRQAPGGAFQLKRGTLPWPVPQGRIASRFGNRQHPTLKTVTQNTGIDITVPPGTPVNVVSDGEVSRISFIPSFGNLVIINHHGGFRTVYAHLAEIHVTEGQHLREGDRVGTSGESLSGPMLHFEIYKDREKQDPEQWLQPGGLARR